MRKGNYRGGSTIIRANSDWMGQGEYDPSSWGPEDPEEAFQRSAKRGNLPQIENREVLLEKGKVRRDEKKRRKKAQIKLTREERILKKYPEANFVFKQPDRND